MRVWRVAGKDGKGFYFTEVKPGTVMSSAVSEMIGRDISSMTDQHPRPDDDGILNVRKTDHFAFSSLDQLHAWFDRDMFIASCKQGALLEIWEVDERHVKKGRKQVCFHRKKAELVEVVKLEKYKLRR
jgi:hypothetical protein